ncbi:MAG: AAA family ATPase, partial [Candidatus Rokubacteria bacterium]|nr:AAA family ATPase [Candidatus Rokubacteria bacterium]
MKCAACQQENPPGAKFCNNCGGRLPAAAPAAGPQAYTPRHLAEKILTSKAALEGERKQVTVLFADLKGSMELLADRDPEEARALLDAVLERMMEAVHRYEGTVNQVLGDGIMALFGAPLAHEDHAVRACYAALRMQDTVGRYAAEVERLQGLAVRIRVGLNSGEVVVRSIGSDLHMDYTAVGQTTHLAARMEQNAAPGSILITPGTLRLAEDAVRVKALGARTVKGLDAPLEVYELAGAAPARSVLRTAAAERLSRFVGRESELERLHRLLADAREGRGRVATLTAEPGVGKSRLVYEFIRSPRVGSDWRVLGSGALSYDRTASYQPVIDVLRTLFEIEDADGPAEIAARVTGRLEALDDGPGDAGAPLLSLLDALPEDDPFQALEARERRQAVLDALTRLILTECERQPMLLFFENLQWVDDETQAFLDALLERLHTARLLLVLDYRPEYEHAWGDAPAVTEVPIEPLAPAAAAEMLDALLGRDPSVAPLHALLVQRSQGNPFFLEEIVRTLAETQALAGERGRYRLVRELATLQVPATVQAVLAARIDRLPHDEKLLLQGAAVIGTDVPFSLLETITELPADTLRGALAHLQSAGLLHEASLFPDLEYRFRSALTRDVAYASLLREQRRA